MTRPSAPRLRHRHRRLPGAWAAGAAALALSACVSLLPKSDPAHLYRFGAGAGPAQAALTASETSPQTSAATAGQALGVFYANSAFPQESAGDRILTLTGGKAAYLAETRWVAPASTLWNQAVATAFEGSPVRLIARGEPAVADYVMRLDVRNFEARYERGPEAPPTVVIRVRGVLTRGTDSALTSERIFEERLTASDNRVSAIVEAYDQATEAVLAEVVAWANAQPKPA